jgi:long-chain acyl-CoA synthetase
VSPLPIEARLAEHAVVSQAVLLGDGRPFVGALLFVPGADGEAHVADGEAHVAESLGAHVAAVNATLAPHEQVRRWSAVRGALSERTGELTPTHKVRRAVVAERHAAAVEALFR